MLTSRGMPNRRPMRKDGKLNTRLLLLGRPSRGAGTAVTSECGALQRMNAHAVTGLGQVRDHGVQQSPDALVVLIEYTYDLVVGHRLDALGPDVVVRDQRDVAVADLELAREVTLGILRHVDDLPALGGEPARLRARGETRPLDDDYRSRGVRRYPQLGGLLDRVLPHHRTVRVRRGDVHRGGAVVERVLAAPRAVDELVADDEVAGDHVGLQRSTRVRADDAAHPELL